MSDRLRVAVVGAGGRIGSALLAHLSGDDRVAPIGICRNAVSAGPLRLAGLEVRCGALRDGRSASELLGDCEVVINCATASGWPGTARTRDRQLLSALYQVPAVRTIVQFSSVAVYGTCIDRERSSFDRPRPHSLYAREKLDLERFQTRLVPRTGVGTFILRLGHVYGPYQWLSRALFDLLASPGQRLPFDGQLPSNAIHVANVCRAIQWLLFADVPPGIRNVVDAPQRTWRELSDWHARAIGARPMPALDRESSHDLARAYKRSEAESLVLQLAREVTTWLASLPSSVVVSSPASRRLGERLLAALRSERLERRLTAAYAVAWARRSLSATRSVSTPRWLLADEVPGPVADYPGGPLSEADERRLAEWHAGYSDPDRLGASGSAP